MYFGSSVIGNLVKLRQLVQRSQKVRNLASFPTSLIFEPPAFENAARYPNSETKVQCCNDRPMTSPSLVKLGPRTSVSWASPPKIARRNVLVNNSAVDYSTSLKFCAEFKRITSGPSYPMGPLGPGPGPPSLRGPQTAHTLVFISCLFTARLGLGLRSALGLGRSVWPVVPVASLVLDTPLVC